MFESCRAHQTKPIKTQTLTRISRIRCHRDSINDSNNVWALPTSSHFRQLN